MVGDQHYRDQLQALNRTGEGMLCQYEAQRHGYAYADLSKVVLDPAVIKEILPSTALALLALPVKRDGRNLWVCMDLPPSLASLERLRIETGCNVIPVGVLPLALEISLKHYYADPLAGA